MKTLMYSTAFALAMTGTAMAQTEPTQVQELLNLTFQEEHIELDATTLPDDLANQIFAAVQGADTENEHSLIESLLRDNGYVVMAMEMPVEGGAEGEVQTITYAFEGNQLREDVAIQLAELGYTDIDASQLTDEQVSQVYLALNDSDGEPDRAVIDSLISN